MKIFALSLIFPNPFKPPFYYVSARFDGVKSTWLMSVCDSWMGDNHEYVIVFVHKEHIKDKV